MSLIASEITELTVDSCRMMRLAVVQTMLLIVQALIKEVAFKGTRKAVVDASGR